MNLSDALARLQVIGHGTPVAEASAELRFALRGARGRALRHQLAELNQETLDIQAPRHRGRLVDPVPMVDQVDDACPRCGDRVFGLVDLSTGDHAWFCSTCDVATPAVP